MPEQTPSDHNLDVSRRGLIAGTAGIALAGCGENSEASQNTPITRKTEEAADFPKVYAHPVNQLGELEINFAGHKILRDEFLVEVLAYNGLPTMFISSDTSQVYSYEFEGEPETRDLTFDTSTIGPDTVSELTPNVPVNLRVRIHNLTKDKTRDLVDTAATQTLSYVKYTDPETGEPITVDKPPEKSPVVARDTYHVRETVSTKVPLRHWPDVDGSLNRSDEPYPAIYPKTLLSFTFPEEKIQYAKYLRDNDDIHVGGRGMVDFTYSTPDQFSQFGETYVAAQDEMYADVANQIEQVMDAIGVDEGNHYSRLLIALRLISQTEYVGFSNDEWRNGGATETSSVRLPPELWADGRCNCSDAANNLAWLLEQMGYRAGTIAVWKGGKPFHMVTGVQLDTREIRSGFPTKVADAILNTDNIKYQIARESDSGSIAPWVYMDPTVSTANVGRKYSEGVPSLWDYRDPFRYDDRDIRGLELD